MDYARAKRLAPTRTVASAWRVVLRGRRDVGQLAVIPLLLATGLYFLWMSIPYEGEDPGTYLVLGVAFEMPFILFAVQWHRVILLGVRGHWRSVLEWSTPQWVFVGWTAIVQAVLVLPGEWTPFIWWGVLLLVAPYLFARASLMLPAVSIGEPPNLTFAWKRSAGNGWRLVFTYFLSLVSSVLVFFPLWLTRLVPVVREFEHWESFDLVVGLATTLSAYAGQVVTVASLSLCFAHLVPAAVASDEVM